MYTIYDSKKVREMGLDEAYMGTFDTLDEVVNFIYYRHHLFTSEPLVLKEFE